MAEYKITVKTGNVDNAGTNANVFITLIGSNGSAGEYSLDDPNPKHDDFERNSIREYSVQSSKSLGDVKQIRIRHDNSGNKPGWFLDFITVREASSGKTRTFPCNRWLAKDEGDKSIDRILNRQVDLQIGWRLCKKCKALVFGDSGSFGACVEGGQHETVGSSKYALTYDNPFVGQKKWKHCNKCHALAFAESASKSGACPSGGKHNHTNSFDYAVRFNTEDAGENNWRYCKKCQGLTLAGGGSCAVNGTHDFKESWDYRIDKGQKYK